MVRHHDRGGFYRGVFEQMSQPEAASGEIAAGRFSLNKFIDEYGSIAKVYEAVHRHLSTGEEIQIPDSMKAYTTPEMVVNSINPANLVRWSCGLVLREIFTDVCVDNNNGLWTNIGNLYFGGLDSFDGSVSDFDPRRPRSKFVKMLLDIGVPVSGYW